jgi:hypothetical protein
VIGVGLPGAVGLKVISSPTLSTTVHWLVEGHETPLDWLTGSNVIGVGLPGAVGLNVVSRPE